MASDLPSLHSFAAAISFNKKLIRLLAVGYFGCHSATRPHLELPPNDTSSSYTLAFDDTEVVINAHLGGRVIQLSRNGSNILTGPATVAAGDTAAQNQYGSTFWVSPQSLWNWPPEVAVDSAAYEVLTQSPELTLRGAVSAISELAIEKKFVAAQDHLRIEYTMINAGEEVLSAAPWEISRVAKGGIAFFPARHPAQEQSTLRSQLQGGVAWVDLSKIFEKDAKLFQEGEEGWLAYAWQGLVFIKSFPNLSKKEQAPGEAEIEIYVNGRFDYLELEQQGPFTAIEPGASSQPWEVQWRVLPLPAHLEASVGNGELVDWVRAQLTN